MEKTEFTEIFGEIVSKYGKELEGLRKSALTKSIIILLVAVALIVLIFNLGIGDVAMFFMFFIIVVAILLCALVSKKYVETFKDVAIRRMIEVQNPNYVYEPNVGVTSYDYNKSKFDLNWDKFESEDGIEGELNSKVRFRMSQVRTAKETRDSDGDRKETTTFLGLYGMIELPIFVNGNINISGDNIFMKYSKSRINLESAEFEKYYNVYADNKVWAFQILNSEAIESFIEMRKHFKKPLTVKICGRNIYFRLSCGDIFEPSTLKSAVGFDFLYKYYRMIDIPRCIYDTVIDNIARASENPELRDSMKYEENPELLEEERMRVEKEDEESWFSTENN